VAIEKLGARVLEANDSVAALEARFHGEARAHRQDDADAMAGMQQLGALLSAALTPATA